MNANGAIAKEDLGEHQTDDHGRRFCHRDRDNRHPEPDCANTRATRCRAAAKRTRSAALRAIEPGGGAREFVELAKCRTSSFSRNEAAREHEHNACGTGQFPERGEHGSLPRGNGARPEPPAGDTRHAAGAAARARETTDAARTDPDASAAANASRAAAAASHGAAGAATTKHCPGAADDERAGACSFNASARQFRSEIRRAAGGRCVSCNALPAPFTTAKHGERAWRHKAG